MHRAIILAAGRGSRMKEYTESSPKCMVKLRGQSLISYQMAALQAAGTEEIALVCGYQKDKINVSGLSMRFENTRWSETNMVSSLITASEWLKHSPCIVSYSDIFYSSNAITSLMQSTADIAVTYDIYFKDLWTARFQNPLADLETFKMNSAGHIIEIGNRPSSFDEVQGQYMGLLKFTPNGWQQVDSILQKMTSSQVDKLDMTTLLQHVIKAGHLISALPYTDKWGEIDHSSDLELYSV